MSEEWGKEPWRETWKVGGVERPRPSAAESYLMLKGQVPRELNKEALHSMWDEELESAGIFAPIPMKVSRSGHDIGHRDQYADATVKYDPLEVVLHPMLEWTDEDYVREVMRHEISHIKARAKRSKKLREELGLSET